MSSLLIISEVREDLLHKLLSKVYKLIKIIVDERYSCQV